MWIRANPTLFDSDEQPEFEETNMCYENILMSSLSHQRQGQTYVFSFPFPTSFPYSASGYRMLILHSPEMLYMTWLPVAGITILSVFPYSMSNQIMKSWMIYMCSQPWHSFLVSPLITGRPKPHCSLCILDFGAHFAHNSQTSDCMFRSGLCEMIYTFPSLIIWIIMSLTLIDTILINKISEPWHGRNADFSNFQIGNFIILKAMV